MKCKIASEKSIKSVKAIKNSQIKDSSNFKLKYKSPLSQRLKLQRNKPKEAGFLEECKEEVKGTETPRCCCCCTLCASCPSSKRTSASFKEKKNEDINDLSIVKEPIDLGTRNVRQILQCVHNGTPEMKDLLLNECDIIYECRSCKNLFRSLCNFIIHKRIYCKNHFCEKMLLFDETQINYLESTVKKSPTKPVINSEKSQLSTNEVKLSVKENEKKNQQETTSHDAFPAATSSLEDKPNEISNSINLKSPHCEPKSLHASKEFSKDYDTLKTVKLPGLSENKSHFSIKRQHLESCLNKIIQDRRQKEGDIILNLSEISSNSNAVYQEINFKHKAENESDVNHLEKDKNTLSFPSKEDSSRLPHLSSNSLTLPTLQNSLDLNSELNNSSCIIKSSELSDEITSTDKNPNSIVEKGTLKVNSDSSNLKNDIKFNETEDSTDSLEEKRKHYQTGKVQIIESKFESSVANVPCSMCDSKFSSKKTLYVHLRTIHAITRMIYPCPFCCLTFKQLFNATRHMMQVHRKGKIQIKFLREAVRRRAYPEVKANNDDDNKDDEDDDDEEFDDDDDLFSDDSDHSIKETDFCVSNGSNKVITQANSYIDESKKIETKTQTKKNEKSEIRLNKGVNPVIYSCVYDCGRYFIKTESKGNHEKRCPKRNKSLQNTNKYSNKSHESDGSDDDGKVGNDDLIIPENLYKDIKKFGNTKSLRCHNCPSLHFNSKAHLIQHLVLHIGFEVLKCKGCAFQTLSREEMEKHLGDIHGIPEMLRGTHMVNLSTPLNNETNGSLKRTISESSLESLPTDKSSKTSGIVLHLRPKLTRNRKKKKIYEIVDD